MHHPVNHLERLKLRDKKNVKKKTPSKEERSSRIRRKLIKEHLKEEDATNDLREASDRNEYL